MKTRQHGWVGFLLLLAAGVGVPAGDAQEQIVPFTNEAGWVWQLKPQPAGWQSLSTAGLSMRMDELKDGQLLLTLAHSVAASQDVVRFRPVAFNAARQRFEFKAD